MTTARLLCLTCLSLALAGCDATAGAGQGSKQPGATTKGDSGCSADPGAWITQQREAVASSDAAGQQAGLAQLDEACGGGKCSAACVELGRRAVSVDAARQAFERACGAQDELGCTLAGAPTPELGAQLCEAGEWLGCALAVNDEEQPDAWQQLVDRAETACDAQEQRACTVAAWSRCVGLHTCDEEALAWARRGAGSSTAALTPGLVACHAGDDAGADTLLSAACEGGERAGCERSCETVHGQRLLVLESARADSERAALLLALNGEAEPGWYPVVSAMDGPALTSFVGLLEKFTPPVTEVGTGAKIPAGLRAQFPVLVEALLRAPNVDKKKIKYWFSRLPDMDDEQRHNLRESLLRQSWMIPGDPSQTPRAFIQRQRILHGGLAPAWGG